MAHSRGPRWPRVLVLQDWTVGQGPQRPRGTTPQGTRGTRPSRHRPSPDRPPLARIASGDVGPLTQDHSSPTRPPFGVEHASVGSPWGPCAASFGRITATHVATPCQRQVNGVSDVFASIRNLTSISGDPSEAKFKRILQLRSRVAGGEPCRLDAGRATLAPVPPAPASPTTSRVPPAARGRSRLTTASAHCQPKGTDPRSNEFLHRLLHGNRVGLAGYLEPAGESSGDEGFDHLLCDQPAASRGRVNIVWKEICVNDTAW